jgi:N-acetylglucosaminyldiphosphoundecaprenol N-acetyl-beta-D-mannosaminyltransferase
VRNKHIQNRKGNNTLERVLIGAAPVDIATADEAARWVLDRKSCGVRTSITPINAAIVVLAARNQSFRQILEEFDLALADGMWPAIAASYLYKSRVPHANTSPFLRSLFRQSGSNGLGVFLLGGKPYVVKKAAASLPYVHPNAYVVGYMHGYFEPDEEIRIVNQINKAGATILLLGISSPKKEIFIRRHWAELNVPISVGVGGLFDIWAGQTAEAPNCIRKYGLEWFFRLCQEPRRLWKRYTKTNFQFIWLVLKQALSFSFNRLR